MRHVAPEPVNAFGRPELKYVQHLVPGVRDRVEMPRPVTVVYAIVQLGRLIPVIFPGKAVKQSLPDAFAGNSTYSSAPSPRVHRRGKLLARYIIEIVVTSEEQCMVIAVTEILHSLRL